MNARNLFRNFTLKGAHNAIVLTLYSPVTYLRSRFESSARRYVCNYSCVHEISSVTVYVNLLKNVILPFASWKMPIQSTYEQDNDPKHTTKLAKEWFASERIYIIS